MNISNASALVGIIAILVSVIGGGAYQMAKAETAIANNTSAIDKLTVATEQLTKIVVAQEAAKQAKHETEARLCKSGAIDNAEWCLNQGYEVPLQ